MEYDYLYKIILLGDSGSGKTSIMNRYLDNRTPGGIHEPTIGVDFRLKSETEITGPIVAKLFLSSSPKTVIFLLRYKLFLK